MADEQEASPTGLPVLPVKVVPYLTGLGGLAFAVQQIVPPHTVAFKVASGLLGFLTLLGLASPGMRKQ